MTPQQVKRADALVWAREGLTKLLNWIAITLRKVRPERDLDRPDLALVKT